jgi:hypothetical protein
MVERAGEWRMVDGEDERAAVALLALLDGGVQLAGQESEVLIVVVGSHEATRGFAGV